MIVSRTWLGVLFALVAACGTTSNETEHAYPPSPSELEKPWTDEFMQEAVLIADSVEIAGPLGLIDRFALRVDAEEHERSERTTPDGFVQEVFVRGPQSSEIRAWLDRLEIVALRHLRVVERAAGGDVVVRASGDVFWKEVGGGEKRAATLELVGRVAR